MNTNPPTTKASLSSRFVRDVKRIIRASWINWLLLIVPVAIAIGGLQDWGHIHVVSPAVVFALNAVAIVPLASLLAFATESVASRLGDTIGALLNVTFGNAVEIIIFVLALVADEVRIVQAAALGSILSNLLLILGMGFVLGGLRYREQLYNASVSQMSAGLLSLSVISLLLPTAFHAAFTDVALADRVVIRVSRGTSVVLLLVYILYLLFQLKSHAFMYESTPQARIDEESHPGVLAEMFDSSSSDDSSSSSSSSSDSDGSRVTATRRIKRALRRKRRKSSSTTRDDLSPPTTTAAPTRLTTQTTSDTLVADHAGSGDEADMERLSRRADTIYSVRTQDFETTATMADDEKDPCKPKYKKSKRHGSRKNGQVPTRHDSHVTRSSPPPAFVDRAVVGASVEVTDAVAGDEHTPPGAAMRRPMNLHRLSSAIKPTFSSTNFPHHQASGKSLALPAIRPMDHQRARSSPGLRRTSSMPDILGRDGSPMVRAASPRPPRVHYEQPTEVLPVVDVVDPDLHLSKTSSVCLLLVTTGLVALCADFLVASIDYMVTSSGVSQAFIGLIILPIVGNAAEHVTAVTVAYKNKMDLAINIALGSSIQIALFVTPLMVLLGWALGTTMSLYFSLFETGSLFASAFIVNYLMIDGRSNYLEGTLLIAVYVIIAIAAFFYPDSQ